MRRDRDDATPHYRRVYKLTVMAESQAALELDLSQFKSDDARDVILTRTKDTFISAHLRARRKKRAHDRTYL